MTEPKNPREAYSTLQIIKRLWIFIRPYKGRFFLASILRAFGDLLGLYPAYALAQIITFFTAYQVGMSINPFWNTVILLGVVFVAEFTSLYYARTIGFKVAEKSALDAQLTTIKHLFTVDIGWHEKENTGSKAKRIDHGAMATNVIVRMWFNFIISIFVNIFGIVFIISKFDFSIMAMTVAFLVVYFIIASIYRKRAAKAGRDENIQDEALTGLIFESISNIRSAKVMSMLRPLSEMLQRMSNDLFEKSKKRLFWNQSGNHIKNILAQIFRLAMVAFIGYGITQGRYEVGFMILFYGYFSTIQQSVAELADMSEEFAIRKYAVGRMTDLLDVKANTDIETGKVALPKDWQKISIKDVSFAYGSTDSGSKNVLSNVTFDINRGEKIGVVGLSGAGKSTLFKLMLKEHEDYKGEILIDGVPLKTISKTDYFNHTAVVLQETEVFNFSLKDNVTISNHDEAGNGGLFAKALEVAHVTEFAKALPSGVDTMIGEKGVKLSGGEKQRVGMARAVFKDPELLLLDEATSHLDVESEEKIQDSLHQFFKTVTAVVIAHRLTTIKEMDKILVMENGRILEQGSFDQLYAKKGRFYELWEKQKL